MADTQFTDPTEDTVSAILVPAFKVGVASGATGFVVGGAAGILTSATPFLFASFAGLQWFTLGSTFWGSRSSIIKAWTPRNQQPHPDDLIKATTISGGATGGIVALLTRGRRNVLPAIFMFSAAGFASQWMINAYQSPTAKHNAQDEAAQPGFWKRMSDRKWSPVKIMNDEEYVELLQKKKLVADAEIAVLDDKIMALRKEQQQELEGSAEKHASTEN